MTLAVLDVNLPDIGELETLLRAWTQAAARMAVGLPAQPLSGLQDSAPEDAGETLEPGPAGSR